jgi:hypothetical protein
MTATEYPTIHNCNFTTRDDEAGRLVRQALEWADADKLDCNDRAEEGVLDALASLEELLASGAGERDDAAHLSACTAAEQAVATRLVETRRWFLAGYCGESIAEPAVEDAMDRIDWQGYFPVIDGSLRLTGEWVYADEPNPTMLSYRGEAMISRSDAAEAGWTIDADEGRAEPPKPAAVEFAVADETIRICGGLEDDAGLEHPEMRRACAAYRRAAIASLEDDSRAGRLVAEGPRGQRLLHSAWAGSRWSYSCGAIGTMATLTEDEKAAVGAAHDAGLEAAMKVIREVE